MKKAREKQERWKKERNNFRREGKRGRERKRQKDGEEIFLAMEIFVTREGSPRERERERERSRAREREKKGEEAWEEG